MVAVAVTVIIPRRRARFNSFSLKGPGIMSGSADGVELVAGLNYDG
jgi:hypothetical protein